MAYNDPPLPKCWEVFVPVGYGYGMGLSIEVPGVATSTQIYNFGQVPIRVMLNDDPQAVFTIRADEGQAFERGEVHVYSIDFDNTISGAVDVPVTVLCGVCRGD